MDRHLRTEIRTYRARLTNNVTVSIPNIPTEIWEIDGKEEVVYSADACDMVDNGIKTAFPNYFKK